MPAVEATFTMFPRAARRCGRAAFTVLNGPVRFTARTRAHSDSSISSRRALRPTPAAFTRTFSPPKTDAARSTDSRTESVSATSQRPPSAVPPARRMARIVSASPSGFTSTANTLAPSAAKSLAVARARPEPAPVMNSTRSVKRPVDMLPPSRQLSAPWRPSRKGRQPPPSRSGTRRESRSRSRTSPAGTSSLLLSQGRHARLYQGGVRLPRRLEGDREARRRRARRLRRRRGLAPEVHRQAQAPVPAPLRPRAQGHEDLRRLRGEDDVRQEDRRRHP